MPARCDLRIPTTQISPGARSRWADAGTDVHLDHHEGDKGSEDPDVDPAQLALVRVDETAAAARVLGAVPHHLDHPDGELADDRALRLELVRAVRTIRPDVVCCPDPTAVFFGDGYFNHRDHRITGWALRRGRPPREPALLPS
jgi:LmbE family N-acetylglucosaminyl deacetylase